MADAFATAFPTLIQGGMGVGISNWQLARAVALAGRGWKRLVLGVVSGTGVEILLARRLQDGDPAGHVRRALAALPASSIAERILNRYYRSVAKPASARYRLTPKPSNVLSAQPEVRNEAIELTIVANFVEVWLAKEGHEQPIGINHLEKIQMLHPYRLYGAMLAGVDYVIEGAGIPNQVPGLLDDLAQHRPTAYKIDVIGSREKVEARFDPRELDGLPVAPNLKRPRFLAVVASNVLAKVLATKASGYVDGFIVEGPSAGGHNAPPRGKAQFNDRNEPIYSDKDRVDLGEIARLGRPFWLAGACARPEALRAALADGAAGIQAGTIFALSEESGMRSDLKQAVRQQILDERLDVLTSAVASPTGFPFKVAQLEDTVADEAIYSGRVRRCTVGHLVEFYQSSNGTIGTRCPAEPVKAFVQKGGNPAATEGSVCVCNGLISTAGYAQVDKLGEEPDLVTLGDDVGFLHELPIDGAGRYFAADAVAYLLGSIEVKPAARIDRGSPVVAGQRSGV